MTRLATAPDLTCPFVNENDARCAHRFSLRQLDQAFTVCLKDHQACATYHQLARERRDHANLTIHITVEGRVPALPNRRSRHVVAV